MSLLDDNLVGKTVSIKKNTFRRSAIWIGLLTIGVLFRIMHYPGGGIIFLFSLGGLLASSLVDTIISKGKNVLSVLLLAFSAFYIINLFVKYFLDRSSSFSIQGLGFMIGVAIVYGAVYAFLGRYVSQ